MMTANEFREWLTNMKFSGAQAARLLGINANTITRYKRQGAPETVRLACSALTWKTDLIAYKITDKTTGEARIAITRVDADDAFEAYINNMGYRSVPDRDPNDPNSAHAWADAVKAAEKQIKERRSDFIIELAPDPFIPR